MPHAFPLRPLHALPHGRLLGGGGGGAPPRGFRNADGPMSDMWSAWLEAVLEP